jgi:hypothetical protein
MSAESFVGPGALGGLERTIGFLISMSATVVGIWLVAHRQKVASPEEFGQARHIAIVATGILTALMFVFLAGPKRFMDLGLIAGLALVACFVFFLWNVATAHVKGQPGPSVVVTYLATFILYVTAGSVALTAVGLLLFVADPTGTSTEEGSATRASVASATAATPAPPGAATRASPPPPAPGVPFSPSPFAGSISAQIIAPSELPTPRPTAPIEYEVQNFEKSSGQVNVGCEETVSARATFPLPEGAEIMGTLSAAWRNTDNAKSFTAATRQTGADEVVAEGTMTGLTREHIFGIANCPGGGRGELVLSGTYRKPRRMP